MVVQRGSNNGLDEDDDCNDDGDYIDNKSTRNSGNEHYLVP